VAFGLTSGAWDAVLDTRIPDDVRAAFRGPAARRSAGRRTHFDATGLDPDRLRG
jgi:hypothetical protein